MRYHIRTAMLLLQTILHQISEHLQDALLTKSLGHFIEVHKKHFFL